MLYPLTPSNDFPVGLHFPVPVRQEKRFKETISNGLPILLLFTFVAFAVVTFHVVTAMVEVEAISNEVQMSPFCRLYDYYSAI